MDVSDLRFCADCGDVLDDSSFVCDEMGEYFCRHCFKKQITQNRFRQGGDNMAPSEKECMICGAQVYGDVSSDGLLLCEHCQTDMYCVFDGEKMDLAGAYLIGYEKGMAWAERKGKKQCE